MAEARQEPPAPRPVRICHICVDFLQSPAAVEPCGHVFCHACIQPQAAPDTAATCPICQGPIGSIRLLQGQDTRAEVAPPRRRLHPFVVRWRQQQQQEQQEDAAPGGGCPRTFSDGERALSPLMLPQRVQRVLEELDRNGPGQEGPLWPPREQGRRAGSGEQVHLLPLIPFHVEPPRPL